MPAEDRPRERLTRLGASALSDSELIAILLRTGIPGANALDVAQQLLKKHGSLGSLSRCSVKELAAMRGVGPAKALHLVAAFGLGGRLAHETISRSKLDAPELVYDLMGPELRPLHQESLRVLLLDTRYCLLAIEQVSLGTVNESLAHPREIFRPAILHSAYAVILVHNHPSGDPSPSDADHRLTRRVAEAAGLLQIHLVDHVIIGSPAEGRKPYCSFKELGIL